MTISKTLSDCDERTREREYLTLAFSPSSAPLRSRWRNNGLSADFLGDYVTTFLPTKDGVPAFEERQKELSSERRRIQDEYEENSASIQQITSFLMLAKPVKKRKKADAAAEAGDA